MTQQFVPAFAPGTVIPSFFITGLGKAEAEEMAARLVAIAAGHQTWQPITAVELVESINSAMAEFDATTQRNNEAASSNAVLLAEYKSALRSRFWRNFWTAGIYSLRVPAPAKPALQPLEEVQYISFCRIHGPRAIGTGIFHLLHHGYLAATGIPDNADSFTLEEGVSFSFTEKFFNHLAANGWVRDMAGQPA